LSVCGCPGLCQCRWCCEWRMWELWCVRTLSSYLKHANLGVSHLILFASQLPLLLPPGLFFPLLFRFLFQVLLRFLELLWLDTQNIVSLPFIKGSYSW
jgi:hypothetical protein